MPSFSVGGAVSKIVATSVVALGGVASLVRCPLNCPSRAPVTVRVGRAAQLSRVSHQC